MASTFPTLPLDCAGRVSWELDAISGRLTESDRFLALQEPFEVVSYLTNPRRKNVFLIAIGGVLCMGLAALIVNTVFSSIPALPSNPAVLKPVFAIACLAGAVVPLLISDWRNRRKASAKIRPMLARSLRPLLPSIEELEAIQLWATKQNLPIRRHIQVPRLHTLIDRTADTSLINAANLSVLELADSMRLNGADPIDCRERTEPVVRAEHGSD